MNLARELEIAKAEVARLERLAKSATCQELGRHEWKHIGGSNCGCVDGCCSVPVHSCLRCGDCDYGDNDEADIVRADCPDGPYGRS